MKKILFVLVLLLTFFSYAQEEVIETSEKKNEIYLNSFNLIAFKWLDVSYERILNEESSVGISGLVSLDYESYGYDSYRKYAITPYYRHFFSKGYAKGFFMEAFAMINGGEYDWYTYYGDNNYEISNYNDVAFGISVGGKFLSKRGFIGEIHGGIGRNLFDDNAPDVVGRGSISFGYRF